MKPRVDEKIKSRDFSGLKVTVMGLGLNGGGLASAGFFASGGADVTVTDLRSEEVLAPSIDRLSGYNIRYVLEKHEISDFENADLVIKNPAVTPDSPYLRASRMVETDISVFLRLCFANPVIAVTGSKGKSTTVSAAWHALKASFPGAKLGGNITTSPLTFVDELRDGDPVVLELSSWQLADLDGKDVLKPVVSVITNIMPDHLNRYRSMEEYVADKKLIYRGQEKNSYTVCFRDDSWGSIFSKETPAHPFFYSAFPSSGSGDCSWLGINGTGMIRKGGIEEIIVPEKVSVPGNHNRLNLLAAGTALCLFGMKAQTVAENLADFRGIPHRLEFIRRVNTIDYYNDTTATIPEALIAAASSFDRPVRLISGGTDKNLDFSVLDRLAGKSEMLFLLEGSATDKMIPFLDRYSIPWTGPFDSLEKAVAAAALGAPENCAVVMSPGCTSFGMFKNEFDRGDRFRNIVNNL